MRIDYFTGRTAIVTGGASGIGRAVADLLAQAKAYVYLADRDEPLLTASAKQLSQTAEISAHRVDVTNPTEVDALVQHVVAERGALDFMFNNAGIALAGEFRDIEIPDAEDVCRVNFLGVVYGSHAAYRAMVVHGGGHIVNVASMLGLAPAAGASIYSATKAGVVALSKVLRAEGRDLGVRVSAVCPGLIDTPIFDNMKVAGGAPPRPPRRLAQGPEDAAAAILRGVVRNRAIIITPRWWAIELQAKKWIPGLETFVMQRAAAAVRRTRVR